MATPRITTKRRASSTPSDAAIASAAHGAQIGRIAANRLTDLINTSRDELGDDAAAVAAFATVLLHQLVDSGCSERSGRVTGTSTAAALRDTRCDAAVTLALTPVALSVLLPGVAESRCSDIITAGKRAARAAAA